MSNKKDIANVEEYAQLFRSGNERGMEFVYRSLLPPLTLFSFKIVGDRMVAEELSSEALLLTWNHRRKLADYAAIRGYVYRIVWRNSVKAKKRMRATTRLEEINGQASSTFTPLDALITLETYRSLHEAIAALPNGNRRVIEMYFMDQKSTGEIARELKLHPSTIKTQKKMALASLKKSIVRFLLMLWPVLVTVIKRS